MELQPIDYKILVYLSKFDELHINKIKKHFPKNFNTVEYRIKLLSMQEFQHPHYLENSSYILQKHNYSQTDIGQVVDTPLHIYYLSELGKKTVEDYLIIKSEKRKDKFWKIFPVIISFCAIIKSFQNELILIWQWLMQSMK